MTLKTSMRVMLLLVGLVLIALPVGSVVRGEKSTQTSVARCTFTATYPTVNLRSGPGVTYSKVGALAQGETLTVVGQNVGTDRFVWWQSADDEWVRSDLGTSDCPATCGNTVCEYGETTTSCSKDCNGNNSSVKPISTPQANGTGCKFESCEACIAAFPCWPGKCGVQECELNSFGCPVCNTAP